MKNTRPCILCFAGLDPSGGAGLQADIEAIAACGGHALPIATCLTVQNSIQAHSVQAIDPDIIQQQFNAITNDVDIAACKISVLPSDETASCIAELTKHLTSIPIVYDPVLKASSGSVFTQSTTLEIIKSQLLPQVMVATPNAQELDALIDKDVRQIDKATQLCAAGPDYLLVTGADKQTELVHNALISNNGLLKKFTYERLPLLYHGSGCTLSSALACYLAHNIDVMHAAKLAQDFTHNSLKHALILGKGQAIPTRIYNP